MITQFEQPAGTRGGIPSIVLSVRPRLPVTREPLRMARAALNWTVRDLAEATGLHRNTITNLEVGRYAGDEKSLEIIEAVLKKAGITFIDENGG